jgi:hypothetical protein
VRSDWQTAPSHYATTWLPAALGRARDDTRRRGEPTTDPLVQKRDRLCTRLAGYVSDLERDRQVALQGISGPAAASAETRDDAGRWIHAYLNRAPDVTRDEAREHAVATAVQAAIGMMTSPALPPIRQNLASLCLRAQETTHGLGPLQYDLKTLSHQGYFNTHGLDPDPGNETLATGWAVLCSAAGIDLPLGRFWPGGRCD